VINAQLRAVRAAAVDDRGQGRSNIADPIDTDVYIEIADSRIRQCFQPIAAPPLGSVTTGSATGSTAGPSATTSGGPALPACAPQSCQLWSVPKIVFNGAGICGVTLCPADPDVCCMGSVYAEYFAGTLSQCENHASNRRNAGTCFASNNQCLECETGGVPRVLYSEINNCACQ
jgi:hypothetical protein